MDDFKNYTFEFLQVHVGLENMVSTTVDVKISEHNHQSDSFFENFYSLNDFSKGLGEDGIKPLIRLKWYRQGHWTKRKCECGGIFCPGR